MFMHLSACEGWFFSQMNVMPHRHLNPRFSIAKSGDHMSLQSLCYAPKGRAVGRGVLVERVHDKNRPLRV